MPSSVMWAEQLRIFPPHRQRCQCLIYLFSSEPPQSLTLLSLISRTFRSISVLPASKASAFFLIQSVKKKKKKEATLRISRLIWIFKSILLGEGLEGGKKKITMSASYLSSKQWGRSQENNVEKRRISLTKTREKP